MIFRLRFFTLLAFVYLATPVLTVPAYAGQLFPPGNTINNDPKQDCPPGTSLIWSGVGGSVECGGVAWQNVTLSDTAPFQLDCTYQLDYNNPYWNNAAETSMPTFIFADQLCVVENGGPTYTCVKATDKYHFYHTSDGQVLNITIASIKKLCH